MTSRMSSRAALAGVIATLCLTPAAHAAVTISSAATSNMNCSGGVCTPTAANAVLNVSDLESMLGSSKLTVNTAGSLASDIEVSGAISWVSSSGLTLDAYESITVDRSIADSGSGSMTLTTDDGGTGGALSFGTKGNIAFLGTSNDLTINGQSFVLANSLPALASDIAVNPAGFFALANSYDASHDGTYSQSPVPTTFQGSFEGLGNTISRLAVNDGSPSQSIGLFSNIAAAGTAADLRLDRVKIAAAKTGFVGALAGENDGSARDIFVSGSVTGGGRRGSIGGLTGLNRGSIASSSSSATVGAHNLTDTAGGLVGYNDGTITNSSANGPVSAGKNVAAGGLVGGNHKVVESSFATGSVSGGSDTMVGGLAGFAENETGATIVNSYAIGAVSGGAGSSVGGLVGTSYFEFEQGTITDSYSTGAVTGSTAGGSIGYDETQGNCSCFSDLYWDTTTSGITNLSQGAGNVENDPGITGVTTAQLQAGLPPGFARAIWKENPAINNGLPYLIANPPPQ